MHFSYDGSPKNALANIKHTLEEEGFKIIEYAPEDGFLFTDYKFQKIINRIISSCSRLFGRG